MGERAKRRDGEGAKRSSWTTFQAEDAAHAKVLGSKRLAALLGFGDIEPVTEANLPGTVLGLDGAGCWLLGLDGARFQELFGPSKEALANLAKDRGAAAWKPVPRHAYPCWLDAMAPPSRRSPLPSAWPNARSASTTRRRCAPGWTG